MLLQPIDPVAQKAASLVWGLEPEKALQQVEAAVQAALPREEPMAPEMSVADRDVVWSLHQALYR